MSKYVIYQIYDPDPPDYNEARQAGYRRQLKQARTRAAKVGQDARDSIVDLSRTDAARTSQSEEVSASVELPGFLKP